MPANYFVQGMAKEIIQSSARGRALSWNVCLFMDAYIRTGQAQVTRIARAFCGLLEGHGNSICSILTEGKQ